jgi:hypothetical protein
MTSMLVGEACADELRCCSACSLPPTKTQDGNVKPLKRCSRCHNAWYHGSECQRTHFLVHKKECRITTSTSGNAPPQQSTTLSLTSQHQNLKVEKREGRGNCLVTSSLIRKGERIRDSNDGVWEPLVPPVLHENCRSSRCTYCFQKLPAQFFRYDEIQPRPEYLLLFCSTRCREKGRRSLQKEEVAIAQIYEREGPPRIFSTAILLYRILVSTQSEGSNSREVAEKVGRLQCNSQHESSSDKDSASQHHTQAVIATVAAMVQASTDFGMALPPLERLTDMVNRIKINGFSICDGESVAMGVGLFGTPSFMNHSCKPNAIQTFQYGQHEPPTLLVTAFQGIQANHEVCISYVDNSCPLHIRRERLQNDYFFRCSCEACQDREHESKITGIRCLQCSNSNNQRAILVESMAPSPPVYRCTKCGNNDFSRQLEPLQIFESQPSSVSSLNDLGKTYGHMKDICLLDSWYVQESGERLVQAWLDVLAGQSETPADQQRSASRALAVLEELLLHCDTVPSRSGSFRKSILTYKAAKLRLFLFPDPRQAIQELERLLRFFSSYYPKTHELIMGLEACLRDAMH